MDNPDSRIHILDESTVNKIAAGEVIERPASVVKELIDNAIDAGSSQITVEVEEAGARMITVSDNGCGMSEKDASLAFMKHATSKIKEIDDLNNLSTLGFRGEALSSIAAVAKVEMITRQKSSVSGTKLVVINGKIDEVSQVGAAVGSRICVKDLFYNTPVRRKYLKSRRTEISHIIDVVTKQALANPGISFFLKNEGKQILKAPKAKSSMDTIIHLFGGDISKSLIPIEAESNGMKLSGYISRPELTKGNNDHQFIFINGRCVSSASISNAIRLGYYTKIPKGRYPVAFIRLDADPEDIDFNVHPTKSKIRLSNENEVIDFVSMAVESTLSRSGNIPEPSGKGIQSVLENTYSGTSRAEAVQERKQPYRYSARDTQKRLKKSERLISESVADEHSNVNDLPEIEIMGQVDEIYIIGKTDDKLVIIDQHAAHERILYEQFKLKQGISSQELIAPVTLDLSPKERALIEEYIPYLESAGFEISEFGPSTYAVNAVPGISDALEDPAVIPDIISDILSAGRIQDETGIVEHIRKTMACRGAIKAGAACSMGQMGSLIQQLRKVSNPYSCPHGRPTIISFGKDRMDRMFKRT